MKKSTLPDNVKKASYHETYRKLFNDAPPARVERGLSQASILSPGRGFMGAFDYTMQVQVGCPAGCLHCYVPAGFRMTPASVRGPGGRTWGFVVRDKQRALEELKGRLLAGDLANRTIYWSGITDPYAASPVVTRGIWSILQATPMSLRPRRIAVQTRFRPDRDVELLARYSRESRPRDSGPAVIVSYSIGTDRNDLIRAWERATPSFEQRCQTVKSLCQTGVFVVVTLSPFAKWRDLKGTLSLFREWGVAYVTVLFFKDHGPTTTPKLFLAYLKRRHPELFDAAWRASRLAEIREVFGESRVLPGQAGFASLVAPHLVLSQDGKE